jgi:hypothetical protein
MSIFIPISQGFLDAVNSDTHERKWKIEVYYGDTWEDITDQFISLEMNLLSQGISDTITMEFRNNRPWDIFTPPKRVEGGDFSDILIRVSATAGTGNEYIQVFIGYTPIEGAVSRRKNQIQAKCTLNAYCFAKKNVENTMLPASLVGYKVIDTTLPNQSILHYLTRAMGIQDSNVVADNILLVKDYLPYTGNEKAWEQIKLFAQAYNATFRFNHLGQFFIKSHFDDGPSQAVEWEFEENIKPPLDDSGSPILFTAARTQLDIHEVFSERVIFRYIDSTFDKITYKIAIVLQPGEYWPTLDKPDPATLVYLDPNTGEKYPIAINVQYPIIGLDESGSDIESIGGLVSVISWNNDTLMLQFDSPGYVSAIESDIGKTVLGTVSGDQGTLVDFDNVNRKWWVQVIDPDYFSISELVIISGGAGQGNMLQSFKTTIQSPESSQIILRNRNAGVITITGISTRGEPVKKVGIFKTEYAPDQTNKIYRNPDIPGRYNATQEQASESCEWAVLYGKQKPRRFNFTTRWMPQAQPGAHVLVNIVSDVNPGETITSTCVIEKIRHSTKIPSAIWTTTFIVLEIESFTPGQVLPEISIAQIQDSREYHDSELLTHDEDLNTGYTQAGGIVDPIELVIYADGVGRTVKINWTLPVKQTAPYELRLQGHEVGDTNWYALSHDGVTAFVSIPGTYNTFFQGTEETVHANIPNSGTVQQPLPTQVEYRIQMVVILPTGTNEGPWSDPAQAQTYPIVEGDVGVGAIGEDKVQDLAISTPKIQLDAVREPQLSSIPGDEAVTAGTIKILDFLSLNDEDLKFYFSLDDGQGITALDHSGNEYIAALSNTTWSPNGRLNNCLQINTSGYAQIQEITTGNTITVTAWGKINSSTIRAFMLWSIRADAYTAIDLLFAANNRLYLNTGDGGGNPFDVDYTSYKDDKWHFYAVIIDSISNDAKLYIDGTYKGTANYRDPTTTNDYFLVGNYRIVNLVYWFDGEIDEVRLYNKKLEEKEIKYLYVEPAGLNVGIIKANRIDTDAINGIIARFRTIIITEEGFTGVTQLGDPDIGDQKTTLNDTGLDVYEFDGIDWTQKVKVGGVNYGAFFSGPVGIGGPHETPLTIYKSDYNYPIIRLHDDSDGIDSASWIEFWQDTSRHSYIGASSNLDEDVSFINEKNGNINIQTLPGWSIKMLGADPVNQGNAIQADYNNDPNETSYIWPMRNGIQSLGGGGSFAPYDYALSLEAPKQITFVNTDTNNLFLWADLAAKAIVIPDGRLGIGSTDFPDGLLDINGISYFRGQSYFENNIYETQVNSTSKFFITTYLPSIYGSELSLRHSRSSIESLVTTLSGDRLGSIDFYGVNISPSWRFSGQIRVVQDGDAGTEIPTRIEFLTGDGLSPPSENLRITPAGRLRFAGYAGTELYIEDNRIKFRSEGYDNAVHIARYGIFCPEVGWDYNFYAAENIIVGYSAPGHIDINNSDTRLQEGFANTLQILTPDGFVDIGCKNPDWCHFYTGNSGFAFDKPIAVVEGNVIIKGYFSDRDIYIYWTPTEYMQWDISEDRFFLSDGIQIDGDVVGYGGGYDLGSPTLRWEYCYTNRPVFGIYTSVPSSAVNGQLAIKKLGNSYYLRMYVNGWIIAIGGGGVTGW